MTQVEALRLMIEQSRLLQQTVHDLCEMNETIFRSQLAEAERQEDARKGTVNERYRRQQRSRPAAEAAEHGDVVDAEFTVDSTPPPPAQPPEDYC